MLKIDERHIAVVAVLVFLGASVSLDTGIGSAASRMAAIDKANALVKEGDLLTADGRFEEARAVYGEAAKLARSNGAIPVEAVRRVANAYYFEGRYQAAATILREFATEAASWRDPVAQAWALADAGVLAGLADERDDSVRYWQELRALIESAAFPPEARAELESKLEATFNVFAPHLNAW